MEWVGRSCRAYDYPHSGLCHLLVLSETEVEFLLENIQGSGLPLVVRLRAFLQFGSGAL